MIHSQIRPKEIRIFRNHDQAVEYMRAFPQDIWACGKPLSSLTYGRVFALQRKITGRYYYLPQVSYTWGTLCQILEKFDITTFSEQPQRRPWA